MWPLKRKTKCLVPNGSCTCISCSSRGTCSTEKLLVTNKICISLLNPQWISYCSARPNIKQNSGFAIMFDPYYDELQRRVMSGEFKID